MPITNFIGFAPDLDPSTPGIFLDCDGLVPNSKGFESLRQPRQFIPSVSGSAIIGAILVRYLDGSVRYVYGNATNLYVATAGSRTSRGSGYTMNAATDRWRFAVFGNQVIATNGVDVIQVATGVDANFSALGGTPPKAKFVEAVNNFVFVANTDNFTNQWWCSGIGNSATWTADIATQAANGRLDDTDGPITGLRKLGADIIIYKLRAMYMGQYVGPPLIWGFTLLSQETGAPGNEAIVQLGDRHVFVGWNDFWILDGGRPQPLKSPLREYFFEDDLNQNQAHRIIGRWDRTKGVVYWHYSSRGASPVGALDKYVAWHVDTNKWTVGYMDIEYAMLPEISATSAITWDALGTHYNTWDDLPAVPYDSAIFEEQSAPVGGVFLDDHALYSLDGAAEPSYLVTGDIGDDVRWSLLTRVKPRFNFYPTGATLTNYYKTNLGDSIITDQTVPLAEQGWYNLRRMARWHRFRMDFPGQVEIIGIEPILRDSARR